MKKSIINKILLASAIIIGFSNNVWAQEPVPYNTAMEEKSLINYALLIITFLLFVSILALGAAVVNATDVYKKRIKEELSKGLPLLILGFLFLPNLTFAQSVETKMVDQNGIGQAFFSSYSIYFYSIIIIIELVAILVLYRTLMTLIGVKLSSESKKAEPTIFEKMNATVPIERENDLDLAHDYDGIRELDNNIPPWWLYGFYASMIFAVFYLWRYHVAHSAPLQIEELNQQIAEANAQQESRLKSSTDNVDENTVKMLDAKGITAGADLFSKNCVACHGDKGQGLVGPNLTDDYWLHGGSMKDIFKTIKYGWPDKGMQSWKGNFSPSQMEEIASYVKSLKGTNPAGAKEKQGELFIEEPINAASDSTQMVKDSTMKK
jgi:cytochrome c oxidase cbb3-type subunit 3